MSKDLGTLTIINDKFTIDATPSQLKELFKLAKKNKELTVKDILYQAKYAKDSLQQAFISAHMLEVVKKHFKALQK